MQYHEPATHATAASNDDRELHRLLDAAIDLPPAQLGPFLERTASRPELALEAEALLREQSREDFLNAPLPGLVSRAATTARVAPVPEGPTLPSILVISPADRFGWCTSRFSAPGGNEAATIR